MSNTFEFAERFVLSFPFSNTITETPSFFQTGFSFLNKLVDKFNQGSFILRDYQILTTPISKIEAKGKVLREYLLEHKKSKPKGYHLLYQVYEGGKPNYKSNGESYYLNTIVSTRKDQKIRKENYELSYNISDDYKRYNFRVLFPFDSCDDNSTRLSDKYGVIIETRNFDAFYTFLLDLGLDLTEDFLNSISSDFEKALDSDSDGKRLKELYEDAPAFVINQIDDDKLFQHFMTLTKYDDKGWLRDFKDASSSLLKVLQGIKNAEFIYNKFNQNQELVTRVYHNLDGTTNFNGYVMPNKTLFASILSGICTEIGQRNTNNLCYSGVTFQKDKTHKIETNGGKTYGDEMLIKQYKGRTVTTTKVIGGGDSPQHNQRFTFEDVAFDEGTSFNLRPLDIVNYIMDGQDRPVALPAIFVFDVAFQEKWEDINRIIRIGIDVLVIIGSIVVITSNPGTLLLALSWAELGISGADILIVAAEEELKKTPEGREFLRLWNTVYVIGGAITGGPLILISGARLLRVVSQKTRKFLLASMVRVILEIKITNFVGSTIKVIDYAEVVKVGGNTLATIQKTTRMQKAGVVFVKGINEADKVEGLVVIYKGTTIAQGSAKVVRTTLDDVFKTTNEAKLTKFLDELFQYASKSKFRHRPTSGAIINNETKKGTYLVGSFASDLEKILLELKYPVMKELNELFPLSKGQKYNLLNVSNELYEYYVKNGGFFSKINAKWVDSAVYTNNDVFVMSRFEMLRYYDKTTKSFKLTGFGKEIHRFEWKHGYRFDPKTKRMLPPKEAKSLKTYTKKNEYKIAD